MPDISIVKTKEDAGSKSLQVTVPVDRVRAAEHKALRYFSQRARLPGFRPGKAPEAVVRRRFGEQIRQTVLEELIRESWDQALSAEALKPIAEPHIHDLKFEDGQALEFELTSDPSPTPDKWVRMARGKMFFTPAKAIRELGLPQTPPRQAFAEAIDWFRSHGYAPGGGS